MVSRSRWTNPLGWRDDEARAGFVNTLDELTQGTSCWNETCERIPGTEDWLICFDYLGGPLGETPLTWCTTSDDPQPPPGPDPGPPPPGYPEDFGDFGALLFPQGGTTTCWDVFPAVGPDIDGDAGPWGGWLMLFESTTIGDVAMEVYVQSYTAFAWTWRVRWDVFGGGSGQLDVDTAPGFTPVFFFGAGGIPDCPGANLALSCSN